MTCGNGYVVDMMERGVVKVRIRSTGTFTAQYDMKADTLLFGSAPVFACQASETSTLKPMILWMYAAHAQYAGKQLPQFVYPDDVQ